MSAMWKYMRENQAEVIAEIWQHLFLVGCAMFIAIAIGVPLGIWAAHHPRVRRIVLGAANTMQTVPSLALFGFLIPIPIIGGTGARPAIFALMLYALLPIVKTTVTGLLAIPGSIIESARAMGMTDAQLLRRVELPLAVPVILSGIRIATVISVGTATIAAAIGADGLGVFIFRGIEMTDDAIILAGAVPAALLALLLDAFLGLIERRLAVKGMRQV